MFKTLTGSLLAIAVTGWVGAASALPINSNGANNSFATAQNIDAFFDLGFDIRIEDQDLVNTSTAIPHVEISGTGDDTYDFYSFTVGADGLLAIFDIDCGWYFGTGDPGSGCSDDADSFDSLIRLYDSTETQVTSNDDRSFGVFPNFLNDTGSTIDFLDSFVQINLSAGLYYLRVSTWVNSEIPEESDYVLNVSLQQPRVPEVPAPGILALFGLGLVGLGFSRRKR